MAGFNVQLWLRDKAQILYSILLPSTQSATADALQADCCFCFFSPSCYRSGSVSADWFEIYSFVKNLTDRFVRLVQKPQVSNVVRVSLEKVFFFLNSR